MLSNALGMSTKHYKLAKILHFVGGYFVIETVERYATKPLYSEYSVQQQLTTLYITPHYSRGITSALFTFVIVLSGDTTMSILSL